MYNKEDLLKDLEKLGIDPKRPLLVHSSMKSIGDVSGRGDTVIDALMEYMKDGLLIFPTHSWVVFPKHKKVFDPLTEPSNVGILPNLFMKREGVKRSLHPSHSVAAIGKGAEEYLRNDDNAHSPAPTPGCFSALYDIDAQILFIGCTLKKNTFIHSVEEKYNIPDRLLNQYYDLIVRRPDGTEYPTKLCHHRCSFSKDISQNYDRIEKIFAASHAITYGKFGDAKTILGSARLMGDITGAYLEKDPHFFDTGEMAEPDESVYPIGK